eukprot:EG_transcript_19298
MLHLLDRNVLLAVLQFLPRIALQQVAQVCASCRRLIRGPRPGLPLAHALRCLAGTRLRRTRVAFPPIPLRYGVDYHPDAGDSAAAEGAVVPAQQHRQRVMFDAVLVEPAAVFISARCRVADRGGGLSQHVGMAVGSGAVAFGDIHVLLRADLPAEGPEMVVLAEVPGYRSMRPPMLVQEGGVRPRAYLYDSTAAVTWEFPSFWSLAAPPEATEGCWLLAASRRQAVYFVECVLLAEDPDRRGEGHASVYHFPPGGHSAEAVVNAPAKGWAAMDDTFLATVLPAASSRTAEKLNVLSIQLLEDRRSPPARRLWLCPPDLFRGPGQEAVFGG